MTEPVAPAPLVKTPATRTVIVASKKSMAAGLILTFFFGPLGLLYATVSGGLILLVLTVIVGIFSLGIGFIAGWVISMIWAAFAVDAHNRKVDAMARSV